jgi:hypothetical protein
MSVMMWALVLCEISIAVSQFVIWYISTGGLRWLHLIVTMLGLVGAGIVYRYGRATQRIEDDMNGRR